ncbi:hypothetical protein HDU96_007194 [Phlyctochytrium bullatum]|nr:hypothetical protein HDU96_007194 [Phlyctochytrium bullatum]
MRLLRTIQQNKKTGSGRRRGGRGGGGGATGGGPIRTARRGARAPMYARDIPSLQAPAQTAKIMISNLDPKVTEKELRELFGLIGPVKSVIMNFDSQGRSKGSATAIFKKAEDAMKAVQEYHNRDLDRRPMRLELVMSADVASLNSAAPAAGASANVQRTGGGPIRSGRRRGRGRGGAGGGASRKPKSAAELDADLDTYMKDETMVDAQTADGPVMSIA